MKLKYNSIYPPLPSNLKGESFEHIFGTNTSMLELFLLKRKIKGPSWLTVRAPRLNVEFCKSWCFFEVIVDDPKSVEVTNADLNRDAPPLVALAFSVKTCKNKNQSKEICMISGIVHSEVQVDRPTKDPHKKYCSFSTVRKIDSCQLPRELQGAAA